MTREDKLHSDLNKGARSEAELQMVAGSFNELRESYFKAWLESAPRDAAGREKLWVAATILAQVEKSLRVHVQNGKIAADEIKKIREAGEPKKSLLGGMFS